MESDMRRTVVISLLLLVCSCGGDMFDRFEHMNSSESASGDKGKWNPSDCTIDQVTFKSFKISSDVNENVLMDVLFVPDGKNGFDAVVEHYRLPFDRLVASWDCIAAKVTVDGTDQIPDETVNDFNSPVKYRLYSSDGKYKEYTFRITQGSCSDIPVASLVTSREMVDKKTWIPASFKIKDPKSNGNVTIYATEAKLRGNNSFGQKKKSYTLKLDDKATMLGMKKGRKWCLVANAPDRTQLRNRVSYELASRTGLAWTPSTEFCELFVNNTYVGLYLMTEKINVNKNRVNIQEMTEESSPEDFLTGGYLLECDRFFDKVSFKTAVRELPINIKSPDETLITDAQVIYISDYFKKIEQYLYMKEEPDPAYRELIDMGSFADVWMVLELTYCADARLPGSVWYHKDKDGPLFAGPVWDFDLTTFKNSTSYLLYDYEMTDYTMSNRSLWYSRLFLDPEFKRVVKERWLIYKPSFDSMTDFIDSEAAAIEKSVAANDVTWPNAVPGNPDSNMSWKEAVETLKANYLIRLELLDKLIMSW